MSKRIQITKRNIWRSSVGVLITAVMSFAGVACAIDESIEPEQPSGELQTATFEFSFSAGTPVNRTRAGELAWDDDAVDCVWVGIFIDDESYGEDNGKLIGAETWNMSDSGTVSGGSHNTEVFSEKVAVSVMYNDANPPKVRAAGVANFNGVMGYSSPDAKTEDARNIDVLLKEVKTWDDYMAIAVDAASADAAGYRIMSNLVTFGDGDAHHNYTVNSDGTVTDDKEGQYIFDKLDGYSANRITGWLHLRRLISHATVNIMTGKDVEVTNLRCQVFNAPTRTYVQERTMEVLEPTPKNGRTSWEEINSSEDFFKISPNAADYFGSDTYPGNDALYYTFFDVNGKGTSFEFTHYDNKHWGLKDGSCEAYADREKVYANSELYKSLCTFADKWYNNYASYFRIYATVTDKTQGITADVVYTIHEGFCNNADLSECKDEDNDNGKNKVRDFMSVRNTDYTYNVTIEGIESIIVSVMGSEAGDTENAGASGMLTEYVYEADADGIKSHETGYEIKLTDAQRSSLKWRFYTPASDGIALADFGTFDKKNDIDVMTAKYPGSWKAPDEYSSDINDEDEFYKAVVFYSENGEKIGTAGVFTGATAIDMDNDSDNGSLKTYKVKIEGTYAAAAKKGSESESLARILYLYSNISYSAGGSEYKPLFVFKQYPQDGRGTLSTPEIESIEFVNSISASPSAAIATYVESMTANWSESSFGGISADIYEIWIGENLVATVESGELSWTTSEVSTMAVDTYTLGVVAKRSDETLKPSAMAVKTFEILPNSMKWNFASAEWQAALESAAPGAKGTNINGWIVSLDGLTFTSGSGDNDTSSWGNDYIQPNGAGNASKRVFSFNCYGPGILKVVASNTNNNENLDRKVTVQLGDDVTNVMSKPGGYAANSKRAIEFYLNITEATTVYIYPTGGLRFYSMEFTYEERDPIEPTEWDFSSSEWQAEFGANAPSANGTNQDGWTVSLDGLTYTSGTANGKWDESGFIQPNGAGDTTKRVFSFVATTGGTLKVTAQSANSSETRNVIVLDADNREQTQGVLTKAMLEYEVVAGNVYIYPGGGIRFYKIEFDGGVQK